MYIHVVKLYEIWSPETKGHGIQKIIMIKIIMIMTILINDEIY